MLKIETLYSYTIIHPKVKIVISKKFYLFLIYSNNGTKNIKPNNKNIFIINSNAQGAFIYSSIQISYAVPWSL